MTKHEERWMELRMAWARWLRACREEQGLTRRQVADSAFIDASYITLLERDGCIPSRSKVMALARALSQDPDETLLRAGYAPCSVPPHRILALLKRVSAEAQKESA